MRELLREFRNPEAAAVLVQWLAVPVGVVLAVFYAKLGVAVVLGGVAVRMLVFNLSERFANRNAKPS